MCAVHHSDPLDASDPPADGDSDRWTEAGGDCDDADAAVHPQAQEVCNGRDDDCDGQPDEGLTFAWVFPDEDGDGFGVADGAIRDCGAGEGYATQDRDCDDLSATTFPRAPELCNNVDDDCDGVADEGVRFMFYRDDDGDLYGQDAGAFESCEVQQGFVNTGGDCDDDDATVNPGATELELCDDVDQDCDGKPREQLRCSGDTGFAMSGVTGGLEFVDGVLVGGAVTQRWYPASDWEWHDIDPALALCSAARSLFAAIRLELSAIAGTERGLLQRSHRHHSRPRSGRQQTLARSLKLDFSLMLVKSMFFACAPVET